MTSVNMVDGISKDDIFRQEPITRSVQLAYLLAKAFSQVGLFLNEAFFCGYVLLITY